MTDTTQPHQERISEELYKKIHEPLMEVFLNNARENGSDCLYSREATSGIAAARAAQALIDLEKLRLGIR